MSDYVDELNKFLPPNVYLNSVTVSEKTMKVKSTSLTEQSILQYVTNLESSKSFDEISLGQISSSIENENFIVSTITINTK